MSLRQHQGAMVLEEAGTCLYSDACQSLKRMPKVIRREALAEDGIPWKSPGGKGGGRQFLQILGPYL